MTIVSSHLTVPFCLIVVAVLSSQLLAADPTEVPEARRLLDEVINNYKSLDFYEDQGVIHYNEGEPNEYMEGLQLRYSRPNKMDLDFSSVRFICDGTNLLTVVAPLQVIDHKGNLLTVAVHGLNCLLRSGRL